MRRARYVREVVRISMWGGPVVSVTGRAAPSVLWIGPAPAEAPSAYRTAGTLAEAGRALRDPLDLVVVWDDEKGRRARAVAELMARIRCPVPRIVVAHPGAPAPGVEGAGEDPGCPVLDRRHAHLLDAELRRVRAVAETDMRAALAERIAHDLSNLLAPIPLALQLLRQPGPRAAGASPATGAVAAVDTAARRAMTAVKDLSALLTAPDGDPVRVGAKHLLILAAREWSGGGVLTDYPPDLGRVRARPVRLARILWCCARRELDRTGADAPGSGGGDLVFVGRNLPGPPGGDGGAVELRVGWVGVAGGGAVAPLEARAARPAQSPGVGMLRDAVEEEGGALDELVSGGGSAGFRVRLPDAG